MSDARVDERPPPYADATATETQGLVQGAVPPAQAPPPYTQGQYKGPPPTTQQPYQGAYQPAAGQVPGYAAGQAPGYQAGQAPGTYGTPSYQTQYVVTVPTQSVVVVGGCPACRIGVLEDDFTCLGVFCAIFFFPLGILCCLAMRQRRCPNCGAVFG